MRSTERYADDRLPDNFRRFFWDCDFSSLSWRRHRSFIIRRLLELGDLEAIRWLIGKTGARGIEKWLRTHHGGGLEPMRLRFWQARLDIPASVVDAWVQAGNESVWGRRIKQ
ncbi:MAG: hypothetical protein N3B12_06200 [Armatimonadetes bacterium]|nr:hypothetical protein [Armatimonadota bacterium]